MFSIAIAGVFLVSHCSLQRVRFSPYADTGSYLLIHGNVAAFALDYIGRVSLVQCGNCTRPYTQAVHFMKLLFIFAIDIGKTCGLAYL